MMKIKDVQVATSLLIQGFLRANEEKSEALLLCLGGMRRELGDWGENLLEAALGDKDAQALEPGDLEVDVTIGCASVSRTPYNLVSAAIALLHEAVDLNGPEQVLADFDARKHQGVAGRALSGRHPVASLGALPTEQQMLVDAANELVGEIDAAEARPVLKMALWDNLCGQLRGLGVNVEERVLAPVNW